MPKRKADTTQESPGSKRSRQDDESSGQSEDLLHPRSILKNTPTKSRIHNDVQVTPSSLRRVLFSAADQEEKDSEQDEVDDENDLVAANNRSARRKSQRTLHQKLTGTVDDSDEDEDLQEQEIAERVLNGDEEEEDGTEVTESTPTTPTKASRPRGRPKGRQRERTPSPPPDLPPHELYFFQNRTGTNKTSANTIPPNTLLDHETYFNTAAKYIDPHQHEISQLVDLHTRAFDQWTFELSQGFNICLYGYGSKRALALKYATHLHHTHPNPPRTIVINGYSPSLTLRDILLQLTTSLLPPTSRQPSSNPTTLLSNLLSHLTTHPPKIPHLLLIPSLDHPNLRKSTTQSTLARLAAHPSMTLLATVDTPAYPLLWDLTLSTQYRFLHHDATTFAAYDVEVPVVDTVNALLGRSGRRLGGKDGVAFVLRSLPENARVLFRMVVAEQLASSGDDGGGFGDGGESEEDGEEEELLGVEDGEDVGMETPTKRGRGRVTKKRRKVVRKVVGSAGGGTVGVEYRTLYHKAVEDFVCSSEVNFRTLLKEFHDHQMIESRKDALGTERLIVPFRREELEAILEELV